MKENPNIADLASITPGQFTFSLLNQIFWNHKIKDGALEIGGVTVTKSIWRVTSNSGKSADWTVTFTYRDAEGERHEFKKESRYSSNRRNDPDRKWGLYE